MQLKALPSAALLAGAHAFVAPGATKPALALRAEEVEAAPVEVAPVAEAAPEAEVVAPVAEVAVAPEPAKPELDVPKVDMDEARARAARYWSGTWGGRIREDPRGSERIREAWGEGGWS